MFLFDFRSVFALPTFNFKTWRIHPLHFISASSFFPFCSTFYFQVIAVYSETHPRRFVDCAHLGIIQEVTPDYDATTEEILERITSRRFLFLFFKVMPIIKNWMLKLFRIASPESDEIAMFSGVPTNNNQHWPGYANEKDSLDYVHWKSSPANY